MTGRPITVVTGASAGVGRATVRELAERGFDVAVLARGTAGLEAAVADVERRGGRALAVPTDVSRFDEVDAAASRIEEELGPIDVWINNAMTTVFAPLSETGPDDFRRALEVTLFGQVWGTKAALARMRPRDAGVVVNVGRRWPSWGSRSRPPTAPPSSPVGASSSRPAPNCSMTGATCA